MDLRTTNILTHMEKLEKAVPGALLVYEILCEFLHPNCGDLFATTVRSEATYDEAGTKLLRRYIGIGTRSFAGTPQFDVVMAKLCPVISSVVSLAPEVHQQILHWHSEAMKRTQKYQRRVLKTQRGLFGRANLCPCLSGKLVLQCCGR